ncbi:Os07g0251132 [Oryza sativa Japonica Group]|uniref:Os07g0251132 protein n=1 Tax=Oryza sativa subsp. japonica TaxID=39947 RepID=C7J547_ORYSJ|nr:Os07g0251132 [Oryza sativa Japonica Group]|eukprot:NP_001175119.1 Os07g0251132 [Oryza sativa Japonica Group]
MDNNESTYDQKPSQSC